LIAAEKYSPKRQWATNCTPEDALTRQSATAIGTIDTRAGEPKRRFDQRLVQWSVCDNYQRHNLTDRGIATSIGNRESASIPVRDRIHELKQDLRRPPGAPT
jgi:hypothetical protein